MTSRNLILADPALIGLKASDGAPFAPAPTQYWSMDDADYNAGTFTNSASALDGVEFSGTLTTAFPAGQVNEARDFSNANALNGMTVPHNTALHPTNFTLSFWLQMEAFSAPVFHPFAGKGGGGTGFSVVKNNTGPNALRFLCGSGDFFGPDLSTLMSVDTWANIVATLSGTTMRLYVNATEVAGSPHVGSHATNTSPFEVNRGSGGGGVHAKYDEVAIWDSALSQTNITALHARGVAGRRLL